MLHARYVVGLVIMHKYILKLLYHFIISFALITVPLFFAEPGIGIANDNLDGSEGRLQTVTLQLKWKHQFQFAGYYAALEKGFYRNAGLNVIIKEAKDGEESIQQVIKGKADFGIAMSDLVLHRAKGQPIVALASIFQHSPLIILARKATGIENIHALKGKRIGMEAHSAELIAYFENEGIPLREIELLPHDYSVSNLISGKVDAISAYSTDEPFVLLNQGIEYNKFSPRAGGIDFYGDTLFTSENEIRKHPERVTAFLAASLKGWKYALENSEEIIELILSKYTQRHSREHLLFEARNSKMLIMPDVVQLGYMNTGRWNYIAQTYAKLGMIDKDFSLDGFLYDPGSGADYAWLKRILGILIAICLLLGFGALILIFFNRKLVGEVKERKRAEEALRESEEKYRWLLDNMADVISVMDMNLRFTYVSPSIMRFRGYTAEEAVAQTFEQVMTPESLQISAKVFEEEMTLEAGGTADPGRIRIVEVEQYRKDGSIVVMENHLSFLRDKAQKAVGIISVSRDITERKRAEEALREGEEKFKLHFDNASDVIYSIDSNFRVLDISPSVERILGYKPDELIGRPLQDLNLLAEDSLEPAFTDAIKVLSGETISSAIYEFVAKDGTSIFGEVSGAPFLKKSKIVGIVCIARDITDRKRAEEALRESEERLRLSIDASGLSFWEWFPETGKIHFDEKWQKSLGYDPGEKAFDTEWWKTHIHPDSKPAFDKALKDYIDGKNPRYDLEYQIKTKTGEWRWGRAVGECIEFGEHGQPKLFLGTHEDITATKTPEAQSGRGEKELKWLFRSMINAFVLFDSVFDENGEFVSYRFVFINEAYERITGVKNEEVQGKTVHTVWPETEPDWIRKYGEVAVTGVSQTFEMYHHPTKKLYYCNVYRPWDNPDRFCVIFDDITERKQIEAELQHARKMESIGVLAGGVAHDFNNILGIVLGNAELALDDVPEWNPAHNFLKEIRSATLRAKDVVQELLRFSRKSTGQKKPLEIGQLVKESMKSLRSTIPSSVDFSLNIPEHLHYIRADPTQIHQILMNLASNASDAMEERGILKVTLENVALEKGNSKVNLEPGKYVKLSVKDTGAGIETEDLSRIFDPYFTTKDIGKGTGMGLAVIYGIVQQHAGGIRVGTEIGKGTTFELYFPAIDSKPLPEEKSTGGISGGKETILFVDDEDAMVNLNRQRLERLGYEVTGLTDAVEALAFFRDNPEQIDLIITDMTMPKMTGDRLAQEILKIRPDMPIILCTGYSNRMSEEKAQELGIRKYIDKPIEMVNLARSVREVLDGRSIA